MKHEFNKGQEAVEFVLIAVLVFFGALFVILLFGNKIASFFETESSVTKTAASAVSAISAADNMKFKPDYVTESGTQSVEGQGYSYILNPDGSASINVDGSTVNISTDILELSNTVLETSGAGGTQDLIKEIAYVIQQAKTLDPNTTGNVEIMFGSGTRSTQDGTSSYTGAAEINTNVIKSGSSVAVIQKDQSCTGDCTYSGQYTIEGTVNDNGKFSGTASGVNVTGNPEGSFMGDIDFSNGVNISNGEYNHFDDLTSGNVNYDWVINCADPEKSFSVSF